MAEWIVEAETLGDLVDGLWVGGKRLVRCKDCKHFQKDECPWALAVINVNDFCSKGERREK